jgi:SAM-dependent methyltransferase
MITDQHAGVVAPETAATYDQAAAAYAARWADQDDPMAGDRHRFVRLLAARPLILDLGCGPGRDLARFGSCSADPIRVVGVDRSAGMLAQARRRTQAPLVQGDAGKLPFRDGAVDGIWACASLLHLPRGDLPAALGQCWRVLRPNGVLYLALQEGDGEGWKDGRYGRRFFSFWQLAELSWLLVQLGFALEEAWVEADPGGRPYRWVKALGRRPLVNRHGTGASRVGPRGPDCGQEHR